MTVINRIKEFLDNRPDPITGKASTSPYRFWKDTQLSRTTAYRLYNDSTYIPTGEVLDKVCSTYRIKPGVILDWIPNDAPQETLKEKTVSIEDKGKDRINPKPKSRNVRHPDTFVAVISVKEAVQVKKPQSLEQEAS